MKKMIEVKFKCNVCERKVQEVRLPQRTDIFKLCNKCYTKIILKKQNKVA